MKKNIISTEKAPAAIGPYSQGVRIADFVFTAGQVAIDPAIGKLIDGDISAQTEQALRNVQAILAEAGTGLENVVKTTVFLRDIGDFAAMNAVYATFFSDSLPARSTVAVSLPAGALVEIEAVALVP